MISETVASIHNNNTCEKLMMLLHSPEMRTSEPLGVDVIFMEPLNFLPLVLM